jgi:hypothetical protein
LPLSFGVVVATRVVDFLPYRLSLITRHSLCWVVDVCFVFLILFQIC